VLLLQGVDELLATTAGASTAAVVQGSAVPGAAADNVGVAGVHAEDWGTLMISSRRRPRWINLTRL